MRFLILALFCAAAIWAGLTFHGYWWWTLAGSALVALALAKVGSNAFLAGLLAGAGVWFFFSFRVHQYTDGLLSSQIGDILGVGTELVLVINSALGGILAGFGALAGLHLRKAFQRPEKAVTSPFARSQGRRGRRYR